jgi:hypothetical protein
MSVRATLHEYAMNRFLIMFRTDLEPQPCRRRPGPRTESGVKRFAVRGGGALDARQWSPAKRSHGQLGPHAVLTSRTSRPSTNRKANASAKPADLPSSPGIHGR